MRTTILCSQDRVKDINYLDPMTSAKIFILNIYDPMMDFGWGICSHF